MKLSLQKRLPAVVGLILIATITILVLLVAADTNKKSSIAPPGGNNIGDGSLDDTTNQEPPEDTTPPYEKAFPKLSSESETYLYQQYIEGNGDITFQALHQTSVGLFAIVESACPTGDIEYAKKTVGIVQFNVVGTLLRDYTFKAQSDVSYVASNITALGLVVITASSDGKNYFINIVDWELENVSTYPISGAKGASVYPTSNSFILVTEYDDDCVFYLYNNDKFSVRSMGQPYQIVSLFEYGSYFLLFSNLNSSYYSMKLQKSGFQTMEQHITNGATLLDAVPIVENGVQKFILLENRAGLTAKKVTADFDESKAVSQKLGNIKAACAVPAENCILIVTSGNLNGLLRLTYDLSSEYTDSDISAYVKSIEDRLSFGESHFFLSIDSAKTLSLIIFGGGSTSIVNLVENVSTAKFAYNSNGTFSVIYETTHNEHKAVGIIGYSR